MLEGIAAAIIGVLLITNTAVTLVTLSVFLGVYWLISGIFDIVRMFMDHSQWGWKLASGLLGILAGLIVIGNPLWAAVLVPATIVWVLAALGIVVGILQIVHGFRGGGWSTGLFGVISLGLGLLLLAGNILVTAALLVFAAAGFAIVGGIAAIVYSFYLRTA